MLGVTPWFSSLLAFDPAKTLPKARQPVLVVHGALDTQIPPHHATRLGDAAKTRKNAPKTEVAIVEGINHLLVPATSGEVDEYAQLKDQTISPKVLEKITTWLKSAL